MDSKSETKINNFAFSFGIFIALFYDTEVYNYLKSRGVTDEQYLELKNNLTKLIKLLY